MIGTIPFLIFWGGVGLVLSPAPPPPFTDDILLQMRYKQKMAGTNEV